MAFVTRLLEGNLRNSSCTLHHSIRLLNTQSAPSGTDNEVNDPNDEEFRVLNLRSTQQGALKRRVIRRNDVLPPRTLKMPVDQDWTNVWPGPRTFHPASVPLPLRQGFTEKGAAPPSKWGNAELMKIPNFLHLTPPAIRKHCEALKQFCTPWPKGLETDEKCEKHFPLQVKTTDYCFSGPTAKHPDARKVSISLKLSQLKFDTHSKDKFLRLVGDRYNPKTDVLTIKTDRCPESQQNYDYALYLLTACYHESYITEPWESMKSEADMEHYDFKRNKSKQSAEAILNWDRPAETEPLTASTSFAESVENLINDGENEYNLNKYKEEVIRLLNIAAK